MHRLPDDMRDLLKQPMGDLFSEEQLIDFLKDKECIVSVGDQVTYTRLKHSIQPIFCIVDFKTRRGRFPSEYVELIKSFGDVVKNVKNPKKTITDELRDAIKAAFDNSKNEVKTRIEVEGEEDLASLAVIYMAPTDAIIIYGLPDKGVLAIKPTKENKGIVKEVLSKM